MIGESETELLSIIKLNTKWYTEDLKSECLRCFDRVMHDSNINQLLNRMKEKGYLTQTKNDGYFSKQVQITKAGHDRLNFVREWSSKL